MSNRRRINISVDPHTYEQLQQLRQAYKFNSVCEVVVAFAHILLDRLELPDHRKYELPEDNGAYIDQMFDELGHVERTPDGTVPMTRRYREID